MGFKKKESQRYEKCPECGGELVSAPTTTTCIEGTGQTYSQKMRSASFQCDIVCKNCGLVVGQSDRDIYR